MSFKVPQLSDAILLVQQLANDTNTSHRMNPDDLTEFVDKTRTVFPMSKRNIVSSSCRVMVDGGSLTALAPTDPVFGILTLVSAPQLTLEAYYNHQDFTQAEIQSFVDQGLSEMDFQEIDLSPDGVQPSKIPAALFTAMAHYGAAAADGIRIERFAENFNSSTQGTTLDQSEIYKAYMASRTAHLTKAAQLRKDYWSSQDRSNKPVTKDGTRYRYHGLDSMPRR